MKINIDGLEDSADKAAVMAEFDKPLSRIDVEFLTEEGFSAARSLAASCMSWQWYQWLLEGKYSQIHAKTNIFIEKGIEMRKKSSLTYMRPHFDLYLLHCGIFSSSRHQLERLAEGSVDADGVGGHAPKNDGSLYASAWSGMLKYSILGDAKKAEQQAELIWGAYRHPSFSAASKTLVVPWLKRNWGAFIKAQQKDFNNLWARGRKDGTVRSEAKDEVVITVQRYPVEQKWCWAHCGLALMAHRQHVEVATDLFWFPPHALKSV